MGLLKLVKDVPGVDFYEYRDSDYYNKYEYRARFQLVGVRYTWYIKHNIQELVDRLDAPAVGLSYHRIAYERDDVRANLSKLEKFIHWRNLIKKTKSEKYSLIRSGSKIKFYYASPNEHNFDIFAYSPGSFPIEFAVPLDREQQFFRLIIEPINKLLVAMGYPELTAILTRKVEIIKTRSRTKEFTTEETYPLYSVNSESLEYCEIPEICQEYIESSDKKVPAELFIVYI